jgi:mono/diheme cytochrome c family protein
MRITLTVLASASLLSACMPPPEVTGRADFDAYCAACHGASGKGDGPAAAGLAHPPADLTRIAARNGGRFDRVRVMSIIDGYTRRDQNGSLMPEMGPLVQEGDLVMADLGDGKLTPTPARLLALAAYLESIQQP